jgi:SAM-dependent methyltransferase
MLSPDQRNALAALYARQPGHFMSKFFLTREVWIQDAQKRAAKLGLVAGPSLRLLDIGCGVPYFLLAARTLGHQADGLDLPDPILIEAAAVMGVQYTEHVIREWSELPIAGGPYDLVTMFGVNLRRIDEQWWEWSDWVRLIRDILGHVAPGGRLVIQPNNGPHCSELLRDGPRWTAENLAADVTIEGTWIVFTRR